MRQKKVGWNKPPPGRLMWNDPDVCRSGRPEVTSGQPWLYYGISAGRDGCIWRAVGGRQGPAWTRRVCLHESVVQAKSLLQKHTSQNRNTVSAGAKYKYICSLGSRMRDRRHCFITVFTENNHFWRLCGFKAQSVRFSAIYWWASILQTVLTSHWV